jgi:hypothetical protein
MEETRDEKYENRRRVRELELQIIYDPVYFVKYKKG